MARNWIRSSLRDRHERVDPEAYAMALFSVRGDRERSRELARDLGLDPGDRGRPRER